MNLNLLFDKNPFKDIQDYHVLSPKDIVEKIQEKKKGKGKRNQIKTINLQKYKQEELPEYLHGKTKGKNQI